MGNLHEFFKRGKSVRCRVMSVHSMAFLEVVVQCSSLWGKPVLYRLILYVVLGVSRCCQESVGY